MVSTKPQTKRIVYIDLLRVISIFSVILLHCISPYFSQSNIYGTRTWWFLNIINSCIRFGVPVFFMVSGFLLFTSEKETSAESFLFGRFKKIFIPFFIWNIVYYLGYSYINSTSVSLSDFLYKFITMDMYYHFWFVYTLIFLYLFVPFFKKVIKHSTTKELIYLLFIIILPSTIFTAINKFSGVWLFRFEPIVSPYLGYMLLGYLLGAHDFIKKQRMLFYLVGLVSILISILGTYLYSSEQEIDSFFNGGYQFNIFLISTAVFIFFKYLCANIRNSTLIKFITLSGNLSFGIYLIHALILYLLNDNFVFSKPYISIIFNFTVTSVFSYIFVFIISKIKYLDKLV